MDEYKTVKQSLSASVVIERSKFIASVKSVASAEEANAFIESVKKEYSDATHNPYAYITERGGYSKFSDDGEPSGTSGAPILESIKAAGLKDTCVVVTRYFGGIKLGTGGLARAYGGAASDVLKAAGSVRRCLSFICKATLPYDKQNLFPKIGIGLGKILKIDYLDNIVFEFAIKSDSFEEFTASFKDALKGKYEIEVLYKDYIDLD